MSRIESIPELYFASQWKFKAEGNANIILAYVGENERFSGTVLRLRKSVRDRTEVIKHEDNNGEVKTQLLASLYATTVIKPLLGEYVDESMLLEVQPKFLREISNSIHSVRSAKRLHKDIDFAQRYAVLISDHTRFSSSSNPSLSMELKPKWVFLPTSPHIAPKNLQKLRTCRFCMHQHYKRLNEHLPVTMEYCPLDFFSLLDERLRRSIEELFKFPSSVLKLFLQGEQLQIEKGWQKELCNFFGLDIPNDQENPQDCNKVILDILFTLLSTAIQAERNLFKNLKDLQRSLDELDIEGVYKYYMAQRSKLSDPTTEEWKAVVDEYMRRIKDSRKSRASVENVINDAQMRQWIYEFLISVTLKDCSVIMTFKKTTKDEVIDLSGTLFPLKATKHVIIPLQVQSSNTTYPKGPNKNIENIKEIGNYIKYSKDLCDKNGAHEISFDYKIHVIDLDPKIVSNIPHYYELDSKIVESYVKNCEAKRMCVE